MSHTFTLPSRRTLKYRWLRCSFGEHLSRVFISHSQKDAQLTRNVAMMLENIGVTPVVMEYATPEMEIEPPYARIREAVTGADYIMLFKTDNAISTEYTKSWILYEVGLAAAANKRLFVFERRGPPIRFPIPYLTDYMVFDPDKVADFLRLQAIANEARRIVTEGELEEGGSGGIGLLALLLAPVIIVAMAVVAGVQAIRGPIPVECDKCHTGYQYYAGVLDPFQCPVCLVEVDLSSKVDEKTLSLLREFKSTLEKEGKL